MATVQVFTAARSQEIEDNTIVSGSIVGDDLILTRNDASTVNAGNVRGPVGPLGPSVESGVSAIWFFSTIPTGWLALEGQVITGADVLYPGLWAAADAGWKSGTTLTLPNMKGKFVVHQDGTQTEFDVLGETGGSKTTTLAATNLPAHQHAIDHDHAAATVTMSGSPVGAGLTAGAAPSGSPGLASPAPDVAFEVNLPNFTGLSGTGSGLNATPFSNLPPYMVVRFIIKT